MKQLLVLASILFLAWAIAQATRSGKPDEDVFSQPTKGMFWNPIHNRSLVNPESINQDISDEDFVPSIHFRR